MKVEVTRIPYPRVLLAGDWDDIVYAISTTDMTEEEHLRAVEEEVEKIKDLFDDENHWSVSLRETRRELVFFDSRFDNRCSLVQFRVRDAF